MKDGQLQKRHVEKHTERQTGGTLRVMWLVLRHLETISLGQAVNQRKQLSGIGAMLGEGLG